MKSELPNIIPLSDLEQDAAAVVRRLRDSRVPTVITEEGRAKAVLISIEAYRQAEKEHELLSRLAQAEKEISAGQGHDLDSVLAEADDVLNRPNP